MFSGLNSGIQWANYKDNNYPNIFMFLAKVFAKTIHGHYLINGNKRLGYLFLTMSLKYFGFHFSWSDGVHINYKKEEQIIINFAIELQNCQNLEKIYNKIYKSIIKNTTISYKGIYKK